MSGELVSLVPQPEVRLGRTFRRNRHRYGPFRSYREYTTGYQPRSNNNISRFLDLSFFTLFFAKVRRGRIDTK